MSRISEAELLQSPPAIRALTLLHNQAAFFPTDALFRLINDGADTLRPYERKRIEFAFEKLLENLWYYGLIERTKIELPEYYRFPLDPVLSVVNDRGMCGGMSACRFSRRLDYSDRREWGAADARKQSIDIVYVYRPEHIREGFKAPLGVPAGGTRGEFSWDKTMMNWTLHEYLNALHVAFVFVGLDGIDEYRNEYWEIRYYDVWNMRNLSDWKCLGRQEDGWFVKAKYDREDVILFFCEERFDNSRCIVRYANELCEDHPETSRIFIF